MVQYSSQIKKYHWFSFLEALPKDTALVETYSSEVLAYRRVMLFRNFVVKMKRYINNPNYAEYIPMLEHLEVKLNGLQVLFIWHTDTIKIKGRKLAYCNCTLAKLGFPRIPNV
jgi:hypothetical protein